MSLVFFSSSQIAVLPFSPRVGKPFLSYFGSTIYISNYITHKPPESHKPKSANLTIEWMVSLLFDLQLIIVNRANNEPKDPAKYAALN